MSTTKIIAEVPGAVPIGRERGTYVVPNDWDGARRRLRALEQCFDATTARRLEVTGVGPGWRCLEVGAGAGSIARWLCQRVGPTAQVVAVDIDTRFLEELDDLNIEVRRQDVVDQPVSLGVRPRLRPCAAHASPRSGCGPGRPHRSRASGRMARRGRGRLLLHRPRSLGCVPRAGGCPEEDFDHCLALLQDPAEWFPTWP